MSVIGHTYPAPPKSIFFSFSKDLLGVTIGGAGALLQFVVHLIEQFLRLLDNLAKLIDK